jgi:hypothetical protein
MGNRAVVVEVGGRLLYLWKEGSWGRLIRLVMARISVELLSF